MEPYTGPDPERVGGPLSNGLFVLDRVELVKLGGKGTQIVGDIAACDQFNIAIIRLVDG